MARKASSARRTTRSKSRNTTPAPQAQTIELKEVPAVTREQIARRAYEIWMAAGCPDGQDQCHWFEAETQLMLGLGQ
ncbi:MAG: DUF2934 domain-containing protein [Planctomycetota bacterium]|jgi:hypothetical protein